MAVTAAMVKELRHITDAPMMDCKKALEECGGDLDAATAEYLAKHNISVDGLKALFSETRDQWIASDEAEWLGMHKFYEGTIEALSRRLAAGRPTRIVTTKNQRFALALLRHAGVDFDPAHLHGLESGPKVKVLQALFAESPGRTLHFIEDGAVELE